MSVKSDVILQDKDRSKLDGIVKQMVADKQPDDAIKAVVSDFKNKYGVKKKEEAPPSRLKNYIQPSNHFQDASAKSDFQPMRTPLSSTSDLEEKNKYPEQKESESSAIFNILFGKPLKQIGTNIIKSFGFDDIDQIKKKAEPIVSELKRIQKRVDGFKDNFYDGNLTAEDIQLNKDNPLIKNNYSTGYTDDQIASLINNKTNNIKKSLGAFDADNAETHLRKLNEVENKSQALRNQIDQINQQWVKYPADKDKLNQLTAQLSDLDTQREIIKRGQDSFFNYKYEKEYQPEIISMLTKKYGNFEEWTKYEPHVPQKIARPYDTDPEVLTSAFDPKTRQLTSKRIEEISKDVKDFMDKKNDFVAKSQEQGTNLLDGGDKETQYNQIVQRIVNTINNTVPVHQDLEKYKNNFIKSNPKIKPLIDAENVMPDFIKNYKSVNAYVKTGIDNAIINVNKHFQDQMESNAAYKGIVDKWNDKVQKGIVTQEIAQKNINTEEQSNPELKKLFDARDKQVNFIRNNGNKLFQDYIVNNLKKTGTDIVIHPSGNLGIKGMSESETNKLLEEYNNGKNESVNNTIDDLVKRTKESSDNIIKRKGVFAANLDNSWTKTMAALSNYIYNKTGIGGDLARNYTAESQVEDINKGDLHKTWEYQGLKSFVNPNFYLANAGGSVPILAGTAVIGMATEGAGLPAWFTTLGTAGLFTANNYVNTYNDLYQNGYDVNGHKITSTEAGVAAANQALTEMPFDLLMNYLHLGIVSKNSLVKPSLTRALGELAGGQAVMAGMLAGQGYIQKTNIEQAEGKDTTGLIDYLSSDEGISSFMSALSFLPQDVFSKAKSHLANTHKWNNLVKTSNEEFKNNALYNNAMQFQYDGKGGLFRDNIKLKLLNEEYSSTVEKNELQKALSYSEKLEKNAKEANLSTGNINGLWNAHNLTMADMYLESASKIKESNPTLAKTHEERAKGYAEQAEKGLKGEGEFHYMIDSQDKPVMISKESLEAMTKNGDIKKMLEDGTIKEIIKSDEPEFAGRFKQEVIGTADKAEIRKEETPPISVKDLIGQEVEYKTPLGTEVGTVEKNENGEYVVNVGEKEYILPVKDKNNPVESLEQLGLKQLPELTLTDEQRKNIQKDAERVGTVTSNNGNEFQISLANPNKENNIGDQVLLVDKKGKYKEVPGMTDETKLSLINKFLREQGLPERESLVKGERELGAETKKEESKPTEEAKRKIEEYSKKEDIPLTKEESESAASLLKDDITPKEAVETVKKESDIREKVEDSKESIDNIQKSIDKENAKESPNQDKIDKLEVSKKKEIDKAIQTKFGMKPEEVISSLGERIKYVKC